MAKAKTSDDEVFVIPRRIADFFLVGERPLVYNSVSQKAANELLLPKRGKGRYAGLKHNPLEEFRESVYQRSGGDGPTRLILPGRMIKKALLSARAFSRDAPGEDRLKQCVTVLGDCDLYGIPELMIARVTNSGKVAAPDMRTRAIVPRWCTQVRIQWLPDFVTERSVVQCLSAAGAVSGLGDWRQEKGAGDYGTFRMVLPNDEEFAQIRLEGTLNAQDRALRDPKPHDEFSVQLLDYFSTEVKRRELEPKKTPRPAKAAGNGNATLEN
jgi:hypothetical protein